MSSNREISCSLEKLLNKLADYTRGEKAIRSGADKVELAFITGTVVFYVLLLWGLRWSRNANESSTKELLVPWIITFLFLFFGCFSVSLVLGNRSGGIKKMSDMKSHIISTKTSLDLISPG